MITFVKTINFMLLRERIFEFLKKENKTSAQFAEEIGVQPSGISHILSGRNNPSLDFIIKMLEKYSYLSSDWLLFGKGQMYKEQFTGTLFDEIEHDIPTSSSRKESIPFSKEENVPEEIHEKTQLLAEEGIKSKSGIKKIVWFYWDNTFEEFIPYKE